MKEQPMNDEKPMGQVIQIDEARIREHLGEMVRGTVEETLNAMLDAEADQLCGAGRYERSQARQDTRTGSCDRTLQTSAGEVNLKVPKLRRQTFETAIIERYRRRESSVEEALIEMYLAGTVNLIGSGRDKAHEGRSHEGLCPSGHAGDRGPGLESLGSGGSLLGGGAVIAAEVEEIVDPVMGGEEALGLAS